MIEKLNEAIEKSKPVISFSKQYYEELRAREQEPTKPEQMLFDSSYLLESLLASLKADLACPHCEGTKVEPSPDRDLGGNGVTNCACLQCKGLGTKEAWYEKLIDDSAKIISDKNLQISSLTAENEQLKLTTSGKPSSFEDGFRTQLALKAAERERLISSQQEQIRRLAEALKDVVHFGPSGVSKDKALAALASVKPEQVKSCIECVHKTLRDRDEFCETCTENFNNYQPKQRRIKCAAVQWPDGRIWEGKNHGEIIGQIKEWDNMTLPACPTKVTQKMQGFVTESGEFVDRKEALKIAQAAGQIIHKHNPKDILLSEDLRPLPEQGYSCIHEVNKQEARSCEGCDNNNDNGDVGLLGCRLNPLEGPCVNYCLWRPKQADEGGKK